MIGCFSIRAPPFLGSLAWVEGPRRLADPLCGFEHPGSHPPLVDAALWEQVQTVLAARRCGERARVHTHFLKGLLHCYSCDRRLILQHVTSASGKQYTYFTCSGRQANRLNCRQRAVPVAEAERRVEQLIACLSITGTQRQRIERQEIERHRAAESDRVMQLGQIEDQLGDLEERQLKLLDVYYAGALPRELFLDQQRDLTRRRTHATQARDQLAASGADIRRELGLHLDRLEDCNRDYAASGPADKQDLNWTLFQKIRMGREIRETEGIFAQGFQHLVGHADDNLMCVVPTSKKSLVRAIYIFADGETKCPRQDSNLQPNA